MAWKRWQFIAGIVLMVGATAASALSLGRVRGTALLGRGLDLSVQGTLEAQEATPEANCFSADLFYGETRVSPSQISISPERTPSGELRIRIRSSSMVDEPVVTLFLRAGCGAAVSRRYVLLSETLSEAESGAAQPLFISPSALPPAVSASPRSANAAANPGLGAATGAGGLASPTSPSSANANRSNERSSELAAQRQARREARLAAQERSSAQALPDAAQASAPRPSVVRKANQPKSGAPRLQVDLLDLTSTELNLRGSAELSSAPSSDESLRRQAQALWRSLNASPEDTLRDTLRLETLESQMRTALEQSKRQGQDIATLSSELQAAQRARYLNPFSAFLGVLALLALALSFVLWRRNAGSSQPWWGSAASQVNPQDEEHLWGHLVDSQSPADSPVRKEASHQEAGLHNASAKPKAPSRDTQDDDTSPGVLVGQGAQGPLRFVDKPSPVVDFAAVPEKFSIATAKIQPLGSSAAAGRGGSMGRVDSTPPPSLMPSATKLSGGKGNRSAFAHSDFASSLFGQSRVAAAEELFDIQEQADFFMSLDQPEQAIEVLKNHITENVETSALAYMDLFDIYHRVGRQKDYAQLREEFNRVFNAQVPEFAQHGAASLGLEDFPEVLHNIQLAWAMPLDALDVIEESIFRQPGQDQRPLDMMAYRELMLLYALAKELARPGAKFSMLPASMQSAVLPSLAVAAQPELPDLDLGDGLMLSVPQVDMLSMDDLTHDRTVRMPSALVSTPPVSPVEGLDFDLSGIDELNEFKLPGADKTS